MLFKAGLYAGEKIFLPGHDTSSQDHDLRIQYIADIGDPCPEDIRHLINCPYTAAVSRFRLFKNPFPVYIGSSQPFFSGHPGKQSAGGSQILEHPAGNIHISHLAGASRKAMINPVMKQNGAPDTGPDGQAYGRSASFCRSGKTFCQPCTVHVIFHLTGKAEPLFHPFFQAGSRIIRYLRA